jgi:hypothetical protein
VLDQYFDASASSPPAAPTSSVTPDVLLSTLDAACSPRAFGVIHLEVAGHLVRAPGGAALELLHRGGVGVVPA